MAPNEKLNFRKSKDGWNLMTIGKIKFGEFKETGKILSLFTIDNILPAQDFNSGVYL